GPTRAGRAGRALPGRRARAAGPSWRAAAVPDADMCSQAAQLGVQDPLGDHGTEAIRSPRVASSAPCAGELREIVPRAYTVKTPDASRPSYPGSPLDAAGAEVHLAHPLGVKAFSYRRMKNDERDCADLADLPRLGRLPEAWI